MAPIDIVKRLRSEAIYASPDLVRQAASTIVWLRKETKRLKAIIDAGQQARTTRSSDAIIQEYPYDD